MPGEAIPNAAPMATTTPAMVATTAGMADGDGAFADLEELRERQRNEEPDREDAARVLVVDDDPALADQLARPPQPGPVLSSGDPLFPRIKPA